MFDMSGQEENVKKKISAGVTTRSQKRKLLKVSRLKSEKLKKSLTYRGPKIWNKLPEEMQNTVTKAEFKHKVQLQIYVEHNAEMYAHALAY